MKTTIKKSSIQTIKTVSIDILRRCYNNGFWSGTMSVEEDEPDLKKEECKCFKRWFSEEIKKEK